MSSGSMTPQEGRGIHPLILQLKQFMSLCNLNSLSDTFPAVNTHLISGPAGGAQFLVLLQSPPVLLSIISCLQSFIYHSRHWRALNFPARHKQHLLQGDQSLRLVNFTFQFCSNPSETHLNLRARWSSTSLYSSSDLGQPSSRSSCQSVLKEAGYEALSAADAAKPRVRSGGKTPCGRLWGGKVHLGPVSNVGPEEGWALVKGLRPLVRATVAASRRVRL